MFDDSYTRGLPIYFILGSHQVILGWECVLPIFSKGTIARLEIPSDLAYGGRGYPPGKLRLIFLFYFIKFYSKVIPPNEPLVFEIELITFSSDGNVYRANREKKQKELDEIQAKYNVKSIE